MSEASEPGKIGAPVLEVEDVSLAFGGVVALQGVPSTFAKHEIRAIIGPNGAGKSSMLNVITAYTHRSGARSRSGPQAPQGRPYEAAELGIARTFQNIALFAA